MKWDKIDPKSYDVDRLKQNNFYDIIFINSDIVGKNLLSDIFYNFTFINLQLSVNISMFTNS